MLKQLMINKKIEQARTILNDCLEQEQNLLTRKEDLEVAINDAATEEEITVVEENIKTLEVEETEVNEKKSKLEGEIKTLEVELEELKSKQPTNKEIEKGDDNMENRTKEVEYLQREEVREFYSKVRDAVVNKRSLTGTDLLIPNTVLNRIQPLIGDYSNLYNEVDRVSLNGTARAIVDGAKPEAIWMEMCDPVTELAAAFTAIELDGYKVGGFIPVCNAILEDSMIDLANYLENALAEAIGKALDKAILVGTGSVGKQPIGIVPSIAAGNKKNGQTLGEILTNLALIDTGEGAVGEIIAVMKRATYYGKILPQTVATTSDGRQVVQSVNNPNLAGLRVVFSNYAPDNKIVLGDFKQYLLGERKGVQIASSTDVRFIEDQTVFKGTARYDGKPVNVNAFALIELIPIA